MKESLANTTSAKERLRGWRKPLAVTAIGISALTACSDSDAEAQPAPEATVEQSNEAEEPEAPDYDPADVVPDGGLTLLRENSGERIDELLEYWGNPVECEEAEAHEVCIDRGAGRANLDLVRNGEELTREFLNSWLNGRHVIEVYETSFTENGSLGIEHSYVLLDD